MTTPEHLRDEDLYERPRYPVDEAPTFRARCRCRWQGPSRYRGLTDHDYAEHAAANPADCDGAWHCPATTHTPNCYARLHQNEDNR